MFVTLYKRTPFYVGDNKWHHLLTIAASEECTDTNAISLFMAVERLASLYNDNALMSYQQQCDDEVEYASDHELEPDFVPVPVGEVSYSVALEPRRGQACQFYPN